MNLDTAAATQLSNAPQQQRSRELVIRTLDAALAVLNRPGSKFTIRTVAAEAGVSASGVCGRFTDREELLRAAHDHALCRLEERIAANLSPRNSSLRETLRGLIDAIAKSCREDGRALARLQHETLAGAVVERAKAAIVELGDRFESAATPFAAEIGRSDRGYALRFVVKLVLGTLIREVSFGDRLTDADKWQRLAEELEDAALAYLTTAER